MHDLIWLKATQETIHAYRRMIDGAIHQLTDDELWIRPTPETNSVAIILRHLGGNLRSRWTDFLTTDGEKPDRDRDREFCDWQGDRVSLMSWFNDGWKALETAIDSIDDNNINQTIFVRGEPHTIPQAILRSLTHLSYHVGQILLIARTVHEGPWTWLSIAPGQSTQHNHANWGKGTNRAIMGIENVDPGTNPK